MAWETQVEGYTVVCKDSEGKYWLEVYEKGDLEPPYYDRRKITLIGTIPIQQKEE